MSTEEWLSRHAPVESGASLPPGASVGRWIIAAFIARGGAGEVYRAVSGESGGTVAALKMLHRDDDAARARFKREIDSLSSLDHPGFPAFFDSGEYQGRLWYAMEFLQPLDLPSGDRATARLVLSVCKTVGALHARGFVHRDIKPANIMSRGGAPVLIDLGLLKESEKPVLHAGTTASIVDGHRVGVGTPGYSAPEQFTGGEISPLADIHAIGVLASKCFAGRPPRCWRQIIRRATSSLPSERYPDVAALAHAVRARHLPVVLGAAAATAVAAAFGAATLMPRMPRTATVSEADDGPVAMPLQQAETQPATRPEQQSDPEPAPQPEPEQEPEPAPQPEPEQAPEPELLLEPEPGPQVQVPAPERDILTDRYDESRAKLLVEEGIYAYQHENYIRAGNNLGKALEISRDLVKRFGEKYFFILAKSEVAYAEFHHLANRDIGNITPLAYVGAGIAHLEKLPGNGSGEAKAELDRAIALQRKMLSAKGLKFVNSEKLGRRQLVSTKRKAVAKLAEDMMQIPGRGYAICKCEVTQDLWKEVMRDFIKDAKEAAREDPKYFGNFGASWSGKENPSPVKGDNLPVSNVSFSEAQRFLSLLNDLPEVKFYGIEYRLPTAEEWEHACLAGGTNGFCRLADGTQITEETIGEVAWYGPNSRGKPHPVCQKKPNAFGLYDMHGNVAEWTSTPTSKYSNEMIIKGNAYGTDSAQKMRAEFSPVYFRSLGANGLGFRLAQ